ncbi:hypothetical protein HDU99_009701 [Rhizoclosmatium hyalinum]|nr:hypothetical protein HDU99_009701 [Rhizoclosmatium hyalinum]
MMFLDASAVMYAFELISSLVHHREVGVTKCVTYVSEVLGFAPLLPVHPTVVVAAPPANFTVWPVLGSCKVVCLVAPLPVQNYSLDSVFTVRVVESPVKVAPASSWMSGMDNSFTRTLPATPSSPECAWLSGLTTLRAYVVPSIALDICPWTNDLNHSFVQQSSQTSSYSSYSWLFVVLLSAPLLFPLVFVRGKRAGTSYNVSNMTDILLVWAKAYGDLVRIGKEDNDAAQLTIAKLLAAKASFVQEFKSWSKTLLIEGELYYTLTRSHRSNISVEASIASAEEAGTKHCSKLMTTIETLTKWTIKLQSQIATLKSTIGNHVATICALGITLQVANRNLDQVLVRLASMEFELEQQKLETCHATGRLAELMKELEELRHSSTSAAPNTDAGTVPQVVADEIAIKDIPAIAVDAGAPDANVLEEDVDDYFPEVVIDFPDWNSDVAIAQREADKEAQKLVTASERKVEKEAQKALEKHYKYLEKRPSFVAAQQLAWDQLENVLVYTTDSPAAIYRWTHGWHLSSAAAEF